MIFQLMSNLNPFRQASGAVAMGMTTSALFILVPRENAAAMSRFDNFVRELAKSTKIRRSLQDQTMPGDQRLAPP
jgi:hypothetical protein